jgi:hypothetical protein
MNSGQFSVIAIEILFSWTILLSIISVLIPSLFGNYVVLGRASWLLLTMGQIFLLGAIIKFFEKDVPPVVRNLT